MSQPKSSLRLRLFGGALGAGLVAFVLLAFVLLFEVRDALYELRINDAREGLRVRMAALQMRCEALGSGAEQQRCWTESVANLGDPQLSISEGPCAASLARARAMAILCESIPGVDRSVRRMVALEPVRLQLAELDQRLLAELLGALLGSVLLSAWLLERGVVRRLREVDLALEALDAQGERALLPEGGDALGRMGGAVNRLGVRLREERERTHAQIVSLQDANRALAEEKRALREAREDLARSERLASVGRLAAGVAHEVGNPMTAVIAYSALLRERLERMSGEGIAGAADARTFAERIERESARVDRILRDLLDLARPRELNIEALVLARTVASARAVIEPQPVWQGCALEVALPAELPLILGEEHYVIQVFVNLFTNSAKAGARQVRVTAKSDEGAVVVEVSDDGIGIAPEVLPRLFEPFFTTASPGQGTGLGLALCFATMERIGGSISARARDSGPGAIFSLRFRRGQA